MTGNTLDMEVGKTTKEAGQVKHLEDNIIRSLFFNDLFFINKLSVFNIRITTHCYLTCVLLLKLLCEICKINYSVVAVSLICLSNGYIPVVYIRSTITCDSRSV